MNRRGFTLIELVMVITIMGLIALIGVPVLNDLVLSIDYTVSRQRDLSAVRPALDRMIRDIERIRDNVSVITALEREYRFIDVDGDDIKYFLDRNRIIRSLNGVDSVLIDGAEDMTFSYYDDSGNLVHQPRLSPLMTDAKEVEIEIVFAVNGEHMRFKSSALLINAGHISEMFR